MVVAGPGLPGATEEAEAVAAMYPGATVLVGDEATTPLLTAASGGHMLHLAAHGRLRSDNPLFSSLVLADGPLTVYELEQLSSPPHHVVLAGCDTGRLQVVAGEETIGLGAALLGGGTATLVAPVIPIPDLATVPLMRSYHEGWSPACRRPPRSPRRRPRWIPTTPWAGPRPPGSSAWAPGGRSAAVASLPSRRAPLPQPSEAASMATPALSTV